LVRDAHVEIIFLSDKSNLDVFNLLQIFDYNFENMNTYFLTVCPESIPL